MSDFEIIGLGGAVLFVGLVLVLLMAFKSLLYICRPDEVLIFSGRNRRLSDGSDIGFRVLFGGYGWRFPIIERVDNMSLNVMEVPIQVSNAYSQGGIPLSIDAIANVKISSDPVVIGNAIERFLGRDPEEIRRVAKETLEGHLRGVLATLTPEEVNEDRLKFAGELTTESEEDLKKLGIHLDTFKIQHVTDEVNYLDSIGREAIANVVKNAEIAESDARRDAEQEEASNVGRANVITSNVEANIAEMKNSLRKIRADLESQVQSEEQITLATARQARAQAEQELQQVRAKLEELRLNIDEVLPAEANRTARQFHARGRAATIAEHGHATRQALDMINSAWREAGDAAMSIYLIEELEQILATMAQGLRKIDVQSVSMIDSGDGKTLASYVAAYPAMLKSIFDALSDTIGIDVPKILAGGGSGQSQLAPKWPRTSTGQSALSRDKATTATGIKRPSDS